MAKTLKKCCLTCDWWETEAAQPIADSYGKCGALVPSWLVWMAAVWRPVLSGECGKVCATWKPAPVKESA